MINTNMIQQEIEQEKQLGRIDDTSGETNPYKELTVNNAEKIEPLMTQMQQWSILSNVLNYVKHSRFNSMNHTLDVKAVNRYNSSPDMDKEFKELDFGVTPQKLQEEYMDMYEGIHSDVVSSNRFDENSDISTTYLGKIKNRGDQDKLQAEESFSYIRKWLHIGQTIRWYKMSTITGHRCEQILYVKIILHAMQITSYLTKVCINHTKDTSWKWSVCLCAIYNTSYCKTPMGHRFEVYTLVTEIHENVDLVLGIFLVNL